MAQMPGRCAKDQQSEPMAAPPRHIIEPLPHWLDPLEIMMPPEQRLETWIILRADQPDLQLIQNGLFFDLGQTIWLRHPRNLKKLAAGVQSKVSIPLSRAVFHILMSQPCTAEIFRDEIIRHLPLGTVLSGESEIELEIIEPGNARVDSLALELMRQVLVMSLEQSCVRSVVNGDLDRVTLYAEVALQAAQQMSRQVLGVPT